MKIDGYISLGSNEGETKKNLATALQRISELQDVNVLCSSPVYSTEPQDDINQSFFLNQVLAFSYNGDKTASFFLQQLLAIESAMGRQREESRRYAPRIIDIDLLQFGDMVCEDSFLCLPHPKMLQRAFVLVPLLDICPEFVSARGEVAKDALAKLDYRVEGSVIYQTQ